MQHRPAGWDDENARVHTLAPSCMHGDIIRRALADQQQWWLHADEGTADKTRTADFFKSQSPEQRIEEALEMLEEDPSPPWTRNELRQLIDRSSR